MWAAYGLGNLGDSRAVKPLIQTLVDEDETVRISAANALGHIGSCQALDPLIHALKDKNGFVRDQAALSLGLIGDDRAVASLNELYGARARQESPSTVG